MRNNSSNWRSCRWSTSARSFPQQIFSEQALEEDSFLLKSRQKSIRLADHSEYGWYVVSDAMLMSWQKIWTMRVRRLRRQQRGRHHSLAHIKHAHTQLPIDSTTGRPERVTPGTCFFLAIKKVKQQEQHSQSCISCTSSYTPCSYDLKQIGNMPQTVNSASIQCTEFCVIIRGK